MGIVTNAATKKNLIPSVNWTWIFMWNKPQCENFHSLTFLIFQTFKGRLKMFVLVTLRTLLVVTNHDKNYKLKTK